MAEPKSNGPLVRIENRKRSTWVFEGRKPDGAVDHESDLVLGDAANTPEVMQSHGGAYSRRCPAPVVTVPKARLDALTKEDRKVFDALVSRGEFQVTPVAA